MAIVHIAIFDAVNSIAHTHYGFTGIPDVPATASMDAAIALAAHDTLVALYPSQRVHCDELLVADLATIPDSHDKKLGMETGRRAASNILARAAQDGSQYTEPVVGVNYFTSNKPGRWRPDPVSGIQVALGAYWGKVKPLAIASAKAYRVPPPPSLRSEAYARAFNEVKALGGDGITTPTLRTNDQTIAGIYWAYDGTPSLCAPPRLYNQITVAIANQMGVGTVELARLLALVNVAMSDAGIAAWESKYYWDFWRPITGIREADPGTGPTGRGDGNKHTLGDPAFTPLGAPASNLGGPDFTPPFPAYPSGHASFGGAVFQMLRHYFGTDAHCLHVRLRRVERHHARSQWRIAAAGASQLRDPVAGRGGERTESHLSRHPLGVRQDRRHRAGPADRRRGVPQGRTPTLGLGRRSRERAASEAPRPTRRLRPPSAKVSAPRHLVAAGGKSWRDGREHGCWRGPLAAVRAADGAGAGARREPTPERGGAG